MASEPNNASANADAEERLRQYAAERRQSVPPSMHQATRNLLQGEVRRTYGANDRDRRSRIRMRWFQAFAWLVIFAAVPLFLIPRHPDVPSKNDQALPSKPNEVNLPSANAPGAAPIVLSDTKEPVRLLGNASQDAVKQTPATSTTAAAPAPIAPPAQNEAKDSLARGMAGSMPQRDLPTLTSARAEAKSKTESRSANPQRELALSESLKKAEVTTQIPETQATANTLNFANTVPNQMILNNFKMEQTGARLKIIDQDGSVYAGGVLTQQAGNDVFNLAGYSRTLNKATIITGQVVRANLATLGRQQQPQQQSALQAAAPVSNAQNVQSARNYISNNSANNSAVANNNSAYSNNSDDVRVQGNAIVGNKQYKLDAQAAPGQ